MTTNPLRSVPDPTPDPTPGPTPDRAWCGAIEPSPPPERLVVTTPEDALAAVPVVLGFEPTESLVMMTFRGRETFHARVDLPGMGRYAALEHVVDQLLEPALDHRVPGVLLVVYTRDQDWAETVERRAAARFTAAGLIVVGTVRSDGSRWWSGRWGGPARVAAGTGGRRGTLYDSVAHPFRAASVLRGQVVHGSRAELAALLDPVPARVEAVAVARRRGRTVDAGGVDDLTCDGVQHGRLDDDDLAVLLLSMRRLRGRDAAWASLTRADAEAHVRFWVDVVQRAPADLAPAPLAVLALASWVSGHGALAWCAVDRCRALEPRHTLAGLVGDLLAGAVSPSTWPHPGS